MYCTDLLVFAHHFVRWLVEGLSHIICYDSFAFYFVFTPVPKISDII